MKCSLVAVILCLVSASLARGQRPAADVQSFEVTPAIPTTDSWFLTDPRQRIPGNSAFLFADAAATLNDPVNKQVAEALAAYRSGNMTSFDSLAAAVEEARVYSSSKASDTMDLLEVASRREDYTWDSSYREQGAYALIPHIVGERKLIDLICVRALRQIRAGQFDDAVGTLRIGYEMGRKVGTEPILICGLVGSAIVRRAADTTAEFIRQPDSPNLYWALCGLPLPMVDFHHSLTGEVDDFTATFPVLRSNKPQDLTSEQWHAVFSQIVGLLEANGPANSQGWTNDQTVAGEITRTAPRARAWYSRTFNIPKDQVESLDAFKVVVTYWYVQDEDLVNQMYAISALPWPGVLSRLDRQSREIAVDEPANPFLGWTPAMSKAAERMADSDRALAALADVEAIRAYAAANGDQLPAHLVDITETPALDNPKTGKPFEYRLSGDAATLSDSDPAYPLTYTIKIRK
ncbi:MAG TPA: hypothetical protein VL992_06735 [Tepidisphaeraceae bacterium]|nr:hypothetical protein [Tepidisphaeraceae bacterium]